MKLTVDDINKRVKHTEQERGDYATLAMQWEKMWRLDPGFTQSQKDAIEKDGREQVITGDPADVVNLAQRLIATQPRIDCPPCGETDDHFVKASKKEKFLQALWHRMTHLMGAPILYNSAWQALVRGRVALEVKWIKDALPEGVEHPPFLIRNLDPLDVGVHRGPLLVEYAYHKYRDNLMNVRQRYPRFKLDDNRMGTMDDEDSEVDVTDFWYRSKGDIWNAVIVNEQFAKTPKKSAYKFIPIVEVYGDSAPTKDEAHRGLSILHSMNGPWQSKCRNLSNMATSGLWGAWPFFAVENDSGKVIKDFTIRPGTTEVLPRGVKIEQIVPQVNLGPLQALVDQLEGSMQKSTFPGVMYGQTGSVQSGYGVSMLSDAASGRIKSCLEQMESLVEQVNTLVLSLIDSFDDDDEGCSVWGYDERNRQLYSLDLTKEDIGGYYANHVKLRPQLPQDDMQRQVMGKQLVDSGYISEETYRDEWLPIPSPTDERDRVWAEQALKTPEMARNMQLIKLIEMYPESYEDMIIGTPFEELANQIAQRKQQRAEEERQRKEQETLVQQQREMLPAGLSPELMQGPPPGMMPPPGPPPMAGGPPMQGPPGPPMQGPPGPPPPGMMPPGGPPPGPPMQPPGLSGPLGGGIPPEMQGQITPEMLGMLRDQNPLLFQQLMQGGNIPPAELNKLLGGG